MRSCFVIINSYFEDRHFKINNDRYEENRCSSDIAISLARLHFNDVTSYTVLCILVLVIRATTIPYKVPLELFMIFFYQRFWITEIPIKNILHESFCILHNSTVLILYPNSYLRLFRLTTDSVVLLLASLTEAPRVVGSSPTSGTKIIYYNEQVCLLFAGWLLSIYSYVFI